MKLPDGSELMHGRAPYDPVKAHEYYMRTRKLRGRQRVGQLPASGPDDRRHQPQRQSTVKTEPKRPPVSKTLIGAATKIYLTNVTKQLNELNAQLKAKLASAQSVKTSAPTDPNQDKDTAESLQKQISSAQAQLTSAVEKLRRLHESAQPSGSTPDQPT